MAETDGKLGVLVVDDDQAMAELTATQLSRLLDEATVSVETDACAVQSKVETGDVDCIVSDYEMPACDGLELLEVVRSQDPTMPFILFTGKGSEEIASEAISAGVTDYLQKEPTTDQYTVLANRVGNAISRQHAVQEAERLKQITDVIRTTQRRLVDTSTPAEVFDAVASSLVDTAPYDGIWLGEYVPEQETIECRARTGDCDIVDQTVPLSAATPEDGPTPTLAAAIARTFRDFEAQLSDETFGDRTYSTLSIPLLHEEDCLGVFTVYADERYEFDETEVDVLIELSWTVARVVISRRTRQTLVERERSLERYETILEVLGDPVYALDAEGNIEYVNGTFRRMTGYAEDDLLGREGASLVEDETAAQIQADIERLLEGDSMRSMREIEIEMEGEGTVHCEDNVALLPFDEECEGSGYRGCVGVVRNIEERIAVERRLRENKDKIEAIHEFAREVGDCDTVEAVCDLTVDAAARILAFDSCYVGLREGEYIVPQSATREDEKQMLEPVHVGAGVAGRTLETGESHVADRVDLDPESNPTDERFRSGMTVAVGDFGIFQAVSFSPGDFTEDDLELTELLISHTAAALKRVEYEADLRDERDRLAALIENLPEPAAACTASPEGPVVDDVNSAFEEVFGYSRTELVGELIDDYVLPPEESGISLEETYYVGNTVQTEVKRRTRQGVRDFRMTIIPVELDGFSTEGFVIYGDIGEQKRRERELERQNDRLEEFTSLVTHDLRNPLNVASGNIELAAETGDLDRLQTAQEALSRMDGLIGDFLSLARQGKTVNDPVSVSLDSVVRGAWQTVDTADTAALEIEGTLGRVRADPERVRTAFENLFRNAVEHGSRARSPAMPGDGGGVDDGRTAGDGGDGGDGGAQTVSPLVVRIGRTDEGFFVADDGPGVPESQRESVFEYGYTSSGGTGFGLAIVKRVVEAHGWSIRLSESESGGARFDVALDE